MRVVFLFLAAFCIMGVFWISPRSSFPFFHPEMIAKDVQGGFVSFHCSDAVKILSQPYEYLGYGTQSVAFRSQDGKYVLKFLLFKHIHPAKRISLPSLRSMFSSYRTKKEQQRAPGRTKVLMQALESYDLAFREFKDESALIAIHLNGEESGLPLCTITDKEGRVHQIDLNRACFVLQHFAEERPWQEKEKESLAHLFQVRAKKGFSDRRRSFHDRHYAFLEGRAVMIDPGNIEFCPEIKADPNREIARMLYHLEKAQGLE